MNREEKIILELCKKSNKNRDLLDFLKRKSAKENNAKMVSNAALLKAYHNLVSLKRITRDPKMESFLRIRKIRSLSGIVIVSALTKPYACPGKCLYCPSQKKVPKSYLKEEPAVARAIALKYSPYKQVMTRLKALQETGHPTDKIDIRIIGGTWSYYPKKYQTWFIKECFEACNNFSSHRKKSVKKTLEKEQIKNERAKNRIIGITVETRPDFINEKELIRLRILGVTRVELGIQSVYEDVLKKNKRGHGPEEIITATRLLKDAGFKICYQIMPNLPGSDFKKDVEMFKTLFSDQDFMPDYLKIYPCAVLKEAPLYELWKKKKYSPYGYKELVNLLTQIKKTVPWWCRIQRIIRDIPAQYIPEGGVKISNLRQVLKENQKKEGWRCKCIRCREVGENYMPREKMRLFKEGFNSSMGKELFLSFENKKRTKIYSLIRIRIPSQHYRKEKHFIPALNDSLIVREIHTYGQMVSFFKKDLAPQHRGLGKKLMEEAEKIAKKQAGIKKVAVIAGIGTRDYYRRLGYALKESYMVKIIKK